MEGDICYFEVNAVFSGESMELLEERLSRSGM